MENEQLNAGDVDTEGAQSFSTRELVLEYLGSDGSRVWATRGRAALDVWLLWRAAALILNDNGVSACSLSRTGGVLLLTKRDAAPRMEHSMPAFKDEESSGHLFTAIGDVKAHLYVTPGSCRHAQYKDPQKKMLREASVVER